MASRYGATRSSWDGASPRRLCPRIRPHLLAIVGAVAFTTSAAQAQSVADIFLKLELIGTWSADCARPASRENPHFVVPRPQGPGPIQRQTIGGEAAMSTTIDVAHELSPTELLVSLFDGGDQARRVKAIWLVERNRVRVLSLVANDGRAIISGGRILASNRETPWINRCGS